MNGKAKELRRVWNQERIPVVLRREGKGRRLRVRLPYSTTNRSWLQNGRRTPPQWDGSNKYWEIPKSWFNDFVERALKKYKKLYIIQPYREQEGVRQHAKMRSDMNASARVWAQITA